MDPFTAPLDRLDTLNTRYAFFFERAGQPPYRRANCDRFRSASIIKVPILLAWLHLERAGLVSREELCDLDAEEQVQGAGLSWLLQTRRLPYADILLLMIALSDNLCTNLVIRRCGLERLQQIFENTLRLPGTRLERKLMDYAARAHGLDNWITPADCERLFDCIIELPADERAFVEHMLAVNQDDILFKRSLPRDTLTFFHKTGSLNGLLHDWGYTHSCRIFLLTENVSSEPEAMEVFGEVGKELSVMS
jgi:beta-lactamase class A